MVHLGFARLASAETAPAVGALQGLELQVGFDLVNRRHVGVRDRPADLGRPRFRPAAPLPRHTPKVEIHDLKIAHLLSG